MDPVQNFEIPQEFLDIIKTARAESYIVTAAVTVSIHFESFFESEN